MPALAAGVPERRARRLVFVLALSLALWAALPFVPSLSHPFAGYDDGVYVTENPEVQQGLRAHGIVWAFEGAHEGNWHPLTWISHMLDVSLFGMRPGPQRAVNIALHAANAALLFLLLFASTGAPYRSAAVAALFAVHPLRVESVVWVAERKDVLSTFFALLALVCYVRYVGTRSTPWLAASVGIFALALMSKPMVVTLPLLMLVLDFWPLGRWANAGPDGSSNRLLREKVPFFLLSGAIALVTIVAQGEGGAFSMIPSPGLWTRLANVVANLAAYVGMMLWPADLAIFYPYRTDGPGVVVFSLSILTVVCLSALAFFQRNRRPWIAAGWAWYVIAVLPVVGLVQAGAQSVADRYTYLPLVGITVILVWAAAEAANRVPSLLRTPLLVALFGLASIALVALTVRQQAFWRDDLALFSRAVAVDQDSYVGHNNFAQTLSRVNRCADALPHFDAAIAAGTRAGYVQVFKYWAGRADCLARLGRTNEALQDYARVLQLDPTNAQALLEVGVLLASRGDLPAALAHYQRAVVLLPDDPAVRFNLAMALGRSGRVSEATEQLREAARLGSPEARRRLQRMGGP